MRGRLLSVYLVDVIRHTVHDNVHQLHFQKPSTYENPEAASAVLGSWWWALFHPDRCWASYKYEIKKFWYFVASCLIFLYELYYDARIHEHQAKLLDSLFIKEKPTRCDKVSEFFNYIFIWSLTCVGRNIAHHQEPKTALAASGFSCVEGCWARIWWMLSGTLFLTTSTNYNFNNLPRMKIQRLPVQF